MASVDFRSYSSAWLASADAMRFRFDLGGVALELLPGWGLDVDLPADTASFSGARTSAPTIATATCSVRVDRSLTARNSAVSDGGVLWERTLDGLRVRTGQVVLDIAVLGPRRYIAAARIGADSLLTRMLNTLVATVVELAGGLCLHATAVSVDDRAVLLLGPSGAGKTTAAELLGAVTCLSNDRVALVPDPLFAGKFWVWALPVGRPPALERSAQVALPLAALLRVVQAQQSRVEHTRDVEAFLHIRQAVEVGIDSDYFEPERLAAVGSLACAARSGVARIALSPSWRPELDAFMEAARISRPSVRVRQSLARLDGVPS